MRPRSSAAPGLAVLVSITLVAVPGCQPTEPPPEPFPNPFVRGFVVTVPPGAEQQEMGVADTIHVPDVAVFLRNTAGDTVATTRTDLSGRYEFPSIPAGDYTVCWSLRGFHDGCRSATFAVQDQPVFLRDVQIEHDRRTHPLVVYGSARLRGGELRVLQPFAEVNSYARVRVSQPPAAGATDSAFVNTFGDYVLPLASRTETARLSAAVGGLAQSAVLSGQMLPRVGASHRLDMVLRNDAPRVEIQTLLGGRHVRTASPGDVIGLAASGEDADGDALRFRWVLPEGGGTLSSSTGQAVDWTLPTTPGAHRAALVASDGRGGWTRMTTTVVTDPGGLGFSGTVEDAAGGVVANATVDVNGTSATTTADGWFSIRVPEADTYILNITKPGYNLVSRVYLEPVAAGRWTLTKGTTVSVDPTQPIDVTDQQEGRRCPGPFTRRVQWQEVDPAAARVRRADRFGRTSVVRTSTEAGRAGGLTADQLLDRLWPRSWEPGCGPGMRVQIPANSLVDADGNPPPGNVDVTLYTVDLLSPFDMPGDYSGRDANGSPGVLESYGAGLVEISAGGTEYDLRSGATATVTIPVAPVQLAAPGAEPPQIPMLRYDEATATWQTIGTMNLVGNAYEGTVSSFSAINADVLKENQACVRIHSPPASTTFQGLPTTYRVEITIPLEGGAAPRVIDREVTNDVPYHAIYNLPTETDIVIVPYDPATQDPYGTFVVNTGQPQDPTDPNRPQYHYDACKGQVTLYNPVAPDPGSNAFLTGLFSYKAVNFNDLAPADAAQWEAATQEYYQRVDPHGHRATLSGFQSFNGFPAGEVRGVYTNGFDLAFGRDMHCVQKPASDGNDDVACYVNNHGSYDNPDVQDFDDAMKGNGLFATVAMEYSRIEDPPPAPADPPQYSDPDRVVKFFVYNADGNLVNKADLDGHGARPIPQLCLVCHGGNVTGFDITAPDQPVGFPDVSSVKMGSKFIAFDLNAYVIDDAAANAFDPSFTKANQQADFHQLNQIVQATNPGATIDEIIDEMYPGGTPPQAEGFVVDGWDDNAAREDMYLNVLRPSCRMCHASQPDAGGSGLDRRFMTAQQLIDHGSKVPSRVCAERVMPHAQVTYDSLWTSIGPHQPSQLVAFGSSQTTDDYSVCSDPPVTPPDPALTFDDDVDPVLGQCVGCHGGTVQSVPDPCTLPVVEAGKLLDFTAGQGYASIVDKPSQQVPGMDLVEPGDPDQSYLVHKVEGTHTGPGVGGCGGQMPLGGGSLDAWEITLIRDWITAGAPEN